EIRRALPDAPLGVNVLKSDARSALAVATAIGARFIRVNVLAGAVVADQGIVQTDAHDLLRDRRQLGVDVAIFADVQGKHAVPLAPVELEQQARDLAARALADGLVVSGRATGDATPIEDVKRVRSAVPDVPILVGSGVTPETAPELLSLADALIVGTSLKRDGDVSAPVDPARVRRLGPDAGWTETPSHQDLGQAGDLAQTELEARRIGGMLRAAGINWNLAPVVDVGYNPANPVIVGVGRSFGANPTLVAAQARAYITGMHAAGVLTALKHFPGHGSSVEDSHAGFVDVTHTARPDGQLAPYRLRLAEGLVDAVM